MDTSATPHQDATETDDSGCFTGSFQNSKITFESTPNSTPTSSLDLSSRKRKATSFLVPPSSSLINIPENCPIFSSTLNESILNNLEKCQISPEVYSSGIDDDSVEKPVKYVKLNSTPVKENKTQNVAYCNKSSPYRKEAIDILYPSKPVIPRKLLTPQKYGSSGSSVDSSGGVKKRIFSPAKKRLFEPVIRVDPMKYFKGNSIILGKIFANLSDGDLYRVSMVSKEWKRALGYDRKVFNRYQNFVGKHKVNKENYSITPPDSPPSPDSPAVSPGSRQFYAFYKVQLQMLRGISVLFKYVFLNLSVGNDSGARPNSYKMSNLQQTCHNRQRHIPMPEFKLRLHLLYNLFKFLNNRTRRFSQQVPTFTFINRKERKTKKIITSQFS